MKMLTVSEVATTWNISERMVRKLCTERIIDFHVCFESIHPFEDYNGRVGRLIILKECLRHGIDPFIIDDKNRSKYNKGMPNHLDLGPG